MQTKLKCVGIRGWAVALLYVMLSTSFGADEQLAEIRAMGEKFDQKDLAHKLVADGVSVDDARRQIMDAMVERESKVERYVFRAP